MTTRTFISAAALAALALASACNSAHETVFTGSLLGASYEVQIPLAPKAQPPAGLEKTLGEIARQVDATFNPNDPDSEISRFNKSDRLGWLPASRALVTVAGIALEVAKLTNGAWDPTAGKLTEAYSKAGGKDPGPATLAAAKAKVGYYYLEARQEPLGIRKTRHGLIVDLKGVAQGYAADEMTEGLKKLGLPDFRIKIGRVVRASGINAKGEVWPYTYQKPVAGVQPLLRLANESVALDGRSAATISAPTSKDPKTPLVDPRSGKLLETDLLEVTIVDPSAAKALALASGLFAMGKTEAMGVAKKNAIAAYLVSVTEDQGMAESTPLFPKATKVY